MDTIRYCSSNTSSFDTNAFDLKNMGVYGPNRHSMMANLDKWILKDALMTTH